MHVRALLLSHHCEAADDDAAQPKDLADWSVKELKARPSRVALLAPTALRDAGAVSFHQRAACWFKTSWRPFGEIRGVGGPLDMRIGERAQRRGSSRATPSLWPPLLDTPQQLSPPPQTRPPPSLCLGKCTADSNRAVCLLHRLSPKLAPGWATDSQGSTGFDRLGPRPSDPLSQHEPAQGHVSACPDLGA